MSVTAVLPGGLRAQTRLEPDANGCVDSTILPKLTDCRIDNCERKEGDHRDVTVRETDKGEAVNAALDGDSRSVMYECREGANPASIVRQAAAALRSAGFPVLYEFVGQEGSITARKDDRWLVLEAASRYYTLIDLKAEPPDFESITDAAGFAEMIERYGHLPVYAIQFLPGRAELAPESADALREVVAMLNAHPDWNIRIESHTDNSGTKMANLTLSARRASTVVTGLVAQGIRRARLESSGLGDAHPVAGNDTSEGRAKNRRIELVKLTTQ
jgi:outer membrane protein OmpA-like peptidoglycan-associated protein